MDRPPRDTSFAPYFPSQNGIWRSSAQNMTTNSFQTPPRPSNHPISCTSPTSIPAVHHLPPIQEFRASHAYPAYSMTAGGMSPPALSERNFNFSDNTYGDRCAPSQYPQWPDQPRPSNNFMRMNPDLTRSYPEAGEYHIPINSQEPSSKRCRLEVGSWEIDALAVARSKNASRQASSQQPLVSLTDMPASAWTTPGSCTTPLSAPDMSMDHAYKNGGWQQHPLAYPSPPHSLDDNSRRLGYLDPYRRRTSSAFSDSTMTGSPEATRSTFGFDGRRSHPTSPTITSATLGSDSRACSTSPDDSTPTFEEIYNVARLDLAPRQTERRSILERFPMEIFMRIMMYCDWKEQIQLRRSNSNIYDMVRLDAIPWETKTAILLHEENFNPINFPKKARSKEGRGKGEEDFDDASSSDDERSLSGKGHKGRSKRGKAASKPRSRAKDKHPPEESLDRFACYSCCKILPAYYFEGRNLENKTTRTGTSQKKRGHNNQADKKVDTRVEYVQVISINPGRPPEWLVKDKAKFKATDVQSYVAERMKRGVSCDDMRLYYRDIMSDTHCIAPVRGVNPFFSASSSTTPPHCETYRPVYQVQASNGDGAGVDNSAYTYEICIPEKSARDESPMARPRVRPSTRICQPQPSRRISSGAPGSGVSAPAPHLKDIIALRRFCILCGAKYGAYRRDCNRKIISKTEEGWWVCDCRKVRQAGVGRSCPDCGKSVIY